MTDEPSLDDIFATMAAASFGDANARVVLPNDVSIEHVPTRLALALNVLLDDLSARKASADRTADRLRILAAAAHDFSAATTDQEQLFGTVAERMAAVVRDLCIVFLLSDDGLTLLPVAIRALDADVESQARTFFSVPLSVAAHPITRAVLETGEPYIDANMEIETMRPRTSSSALDFIQRIGQHSFMILPLRVHGRTLGQLTLSRYRPESPPFDKDDLSLALAVADHASIAIANSRSYAAERAARAAAEKAQGELRATEERYRLMFDMSPLPKWLHDAETLQFLAVNDAAVREYGYTRDEFLAMTIKDIRPPEDIPALLEAERNADDSRPFGVWRHRKKSGEIIQVELIKHTFMLAARRCRLAVANNVTERLRLEEQLRQSQKMEAVGRLAGGVAHDFNNILSVILSYASLLLNETKPGEPMRDDIEEIRRAARRAAELTRQLLMFSRQQVLEPKVLDLNEVLTGMDRMLQRILGADVDLVSLPAPALGRVRVDPSSMEQVIMNLVVNARDAMPTGGKLTLETRNIELDDAYAETHHGVKPGPHVMLAVSDTGSGMDKATQMRMFEPFFTTKERGKGTGLGLSTVFGIVQQSGGSIWVYSELNQGTTFKVYLPRVDATADLVRAGGSPATLRGSETILLVEDDDQVRAVAKSILRKSGYQVIEARNAGDALLHSERHRGTIDLLLSDVVMPQLSGPELARRLASARPTMKVLCMSGYTDDSIVRHGVLKAQIAFLQKPITPEALTAKVREVLDSPFPQREVVPDAGE